MSELREEFEKEANNSWDYNIDHYAYWLEQQLTFEREAKQELIEVLISTTRDFENRLYCAKNEAMKKWWKIEIKLLKQLIEKHTGKKIEEIIK